MSSLAKRRRETEIYSLSFLDCICCGFGAIILIFVISIGSRQREQLDVMLVTPDKKVWRSGK